MLILYVLGPLLIYLFHCIAYFMLTKQKYGIIKSIIVWTIVSIFSIMVIVGLLAYQINTLAGISTRFLITLIAFAITFFVMSSDTFPKALFLFASYSIFYVVVQFVSGYVATKLFGGSELSIFIIRNLIYILALLYYYFFVKKHFDAISSNITHGWLPLGVVSILFFSYISYIVFGEFGIYDNFAVILFFLITGIIVAVYFVIFSTIGYMHEVADSQIVKMQSDFLAIQVEEMQNFVEDAKRSRHDIRHHNLLIAEYAKNGEVEELLKYLNAYEKEAEQSKVVYVCQNLTVNNILIAYIEKARQSSIELKFDANVPQNIAVKDTDLVAIIANMLENCILGCIRSNEENKKIEIYIAKKENKLVIQTKNSCANDICFENGLPLSKDKRGVGVSSIIHSAKRYSGEVDFKCEYNIFISRVLLNI